MRAFAVFSIMALTGMLLPLAVQAAPNGKLLELINAYRANPLPCEGEQSEALPPLAADAALHQLKITGNGQLQEAMRAAGYLASRAEAMRISGPSNPHEAMRFAVERNCRLLLSQRYSAAGVSQQGREWHIVLAQPLLATDLGDWREAGLQVLQRVNAARASERICGNARYKPVPALRWNATLGTTSLKHSRDMATHNYFAHAGRDGNTVATRAKDAGYAWRSIGENIAAGQGSPQLAVEGWLASPGHCANIMSGNFTEMGAAYATNRKSNATIYWTQVFGSPR